MKNNFYEYLTEDVKALLNNYELTEDQKKMIGNEGYSEFKHVSYSEVNEVIEEIAQGTLEERGIEADAGNILDILVNEPDLFKHVSYSEVNEEIERIIEESAAKLKITLQEI